MNMNFPSLDSIRSSIQGFISDLREQRLWPVLAVLLVAIVAVPVLLSKSSSPQPVAALPPVAAGVGPNVPTVTVAAAPSAVAPKGSSHDPFVQQKLPAAPATTTASTTSPGTAATSAPAASSVPVSTTSASKPASSTPVSTTTPTQVSTPAGSSTQVTYFTYAVDLAFGSVGSTAPKYRNVERLSPFPSAKNPILVFLGVQSDRKTVVFLVSSLAAPAGQGKCTPSARQCEFLSMTAGQRELLLVRNASGGLNEYKLGVAAVHLVKTGSVTAARLSYTRESAAGNAIVAQALPYSEGLQEMSYSANTGLLSWHAAPAAWVRRWKRSTGGTVPTSVMLEPVQRS